MFSWTCTMCFQSLLSQTLTGPLPAATQDNIHAVMSGLLFKEKLWCSDWCVSWFGILDNQGTLRETPSSCLSFSVGQCEAGNRWPAGIMSCIMSLCTHALAQLAQRKKRMDGSSNYKDMPQVSLPRLKLQAECCKEHPKCELMEEICLTTNQ